MRSVGRMLGQSTLSFMFYMISRSVLLMEKGDTIRIFYDLCSDKSTYAIITPMLE